MQDLTPEQRRAAALALCDLFAAIYGEPERIPAGARRAAALIRQGHDAEAVRSIRTAVQSYCLCWTIEDLLGLRKPGQHVR